jgi:hypothetical protein
MRRIRRALLAFMVPLAIIAVLAAAAMRWVDQQSARARLAEAQLEPALTRADAAEARAVRAEASLTGIARQRIAEMRATATVVAQANEPQNALKRHLGRLFTVFQEPTSPAYDQLSQVFGPSALETLRPEADHLRSTSGHLGGASTFSIEPSPPQQVAPDRVEVHTVERWLYDERDGSDRRQRCFVEDSDQTYVLRLNDQAWIVEEMRVGETQRTDCPPGT